MNDVIWSRNESSIWDCAYTLEVADCQRLSRAGVICYGGDNNAGENSTLIGGRQQKKVTYILTDSLFAMTGRTT